MNGYVLHTPSSALVQLIAYKIIYAIRTTGAILHLFSVPEIYCYFLVSFHRTYYSHSFRYSHLNLFLSHYISSIIPIKIFYNLIGSQKKQFFIYKNSLNISRMEGSLTWLLMITLCLYIFVNFGSAINKIVGIPKTILHDGITCLVTMTLLYTHVARQILVIV